MSGAAVLHRIFLTFAFFFANFSSAETQCPPALQPLPPDAIPALMASAKNRGFLWQISKAGHTSWLYGTLHVGKIEWAFPGPAIVDAVKNSDAVAMELDVSDAATLQKLNELSSKNAGRIPDIFKPRLKKIMASACMPDELMNSLSPAILLSTIELFEARFEGLEFSYGVEPVLTGFAHSLKKPVIALETAESQMAALLGPTGTLSNDEIEDALQLLEKGQSKIILKRLASDWSLGNIDDLTRYNEWCGCVDTAPERAEMVRILDDRNGSMADAVMKLTAQGKSVFVAVGALHMVGDKGLPALLRQKGYEVKPILFK